ncbi:hypothetical protein KDA_33690 [Dictyobacter alpinus]|uniref:UbiC transcription regulator-associated domain-containing protein n=1 Tax=Dictyobacter alpinus TaxID=2014873 RepID=A0A402B964_9CHLR|nr:UTRA domain-containing protein [Dictyobacter alpinus]GCE27885.1 hypothetical protein KDA_33690 [Dictyobacter alpinus]
MRGPLAKDILNTAPPELRMGAKATKAYLDMREKILSGHYQTDQIIIPKDIEENYHINNNSTQLLILRLAMEGLIKVSPVKERSWPNNAAINEYRIADMNIRHRILSNRQGGFTVDISQGQKQSAIKEVQAIEVEYADREVAELLNIEPGEKVVFYRTIQKLDQETVIAISDTYIPFWIVEALPELKKPTTSLYQTMRQLGKKPTWCTETIDITQASSPERVAFKLSPDDPSPLIKIIRKVYNDDGEVLSVDFLTDRGDLYRLKYSFPLYAEDIPKQMRNK